ncbi:hypothetical protein MA4S0726RA_1833 [Mycobacteroides abscessus 4S-0726-RA]|nr:hypothetical protein MA4S0726RA_1833 [Mycobacteroides abscessus 4S-0726-RA]EIU00598.1 hypothetical protein MA4S0303_1087 [Mycobacteroides abscessus 4S-0303]EIV15349.1 hypothetical protein MA4S0206_0025 [Mycobacteroides abscessus 4S-0206]
MTIKVVNFDITLGGPWRTVKRSDGAGQVSQRPSVPMSGVVNSWLPACGYWACAPGPPSPSARSAAPRV